MGDAGGVGPEIALKACRDRLLVPWPNIIVGDITVMRECASHLGWNARIESVTGPQDAEPGRINVLDVGLIQKNEIAKGGISKKSGQAALKYVERAVNLTIAGQTCAVVTLPMNKEATRLSVPEFSGHTGYIADMCKCADYTMTLVTDGLIVPHVSSHVSLRKALDTLSAERILKVIELSEQLLKRLGRKRRIAVMGINPHAGEGGAFGNEEKIHIEPASEAARRKGIDATDPLPPDTVFMRALKGDFDAVVCMYHDQGHITMKTLGLDDAVNLTCGLPIVRTSVDHGTAFDIAYKGVASEGSFLKACELAVKLTERQVV